MAILPLEYALPAKPKLLFILIELTGKRPTYCYADESADVDRLYSMSISLLSKKKTAFSALSMFWSTRVTSETMGTRNV